MGSFTGKHPEYGEGHTGGGWETCHHGAQG
jgi:hypothetical protein